MLIQLLLSIPVTILEGLASFLPTVTAFPFGIDAILVSGVGYYNYLSVQVPFFPLLMSAFMFIIWWKIGLRIFSIIPIIGRLIR